MCDFRGLRIRIFAVLGSDHHIFQRIVTKFRTELKLSNANFVFSGKWVRKYKSDFMHVQIPVSVSISALWNDYALIRCGFSPNFACYSGVISSTRVGFVRNETGIPILEV